MAALSLLEKLSGLPAVANLEFYRRYATIFFPLAIRYNTLSTLVIAIGKSHANLKSV